MDPLKTKLESSSCQLVKKFLIKLCITNVNNCSCLFLKMIQNIFHNVNSFYVLIIIFFFILVIIIFSLNVVFV